ncbi:effector family protein Eff1-7 [Ustilago sp. UG-2017a]|nr:effector family protein Eff1-7 [Ustilago sp. UG-2017a]
MRNPLSLHSGLGSLLFLSLVPVALSLPTGPNYGLSPYGFQNHGFQNHDFQNHDFQNHGFQNHDFPNHGFQNHDFHSQNPNQWPPSSLQSVLPQQDSNVPQHQFPQQHMRPFGDAPQLAQNPPGFSSTSHPLSGDEMDRIILDIAYDDLSNKVPFSPPSLPSSPARDGRISDEGASSSDTRYRYKTPDGFQDHGFQNHDFQNHGFQNHDFKNHGFQNHDFQNHDFQNHGFQNHDFQNHDFQNHGFQNHDFPNHGFQNHDFHSQNPNQWPPSSLQSVAPQQDSNVPQHQFPQQHLRPSWNAPQLAQNPPGFSSTSRILPDEEWDRFVWDSALKSSPRRESLIPPPLPPSHAGSYPSSSEARGFLEPGPSYNHAVELRQNAEGALQRQNEPDVPPHGSVATAMHSRISDEGASSSDTRHERKRARYRYTTPEDIKEYVKKMENSRNEPDALSEFVYSASPFESEHSSLKDKNKKTAFPKVENLALFQEINRKIFGGELTKIEPSKLPPNTWVHYKTKVHQPTRELPFVTFDPHDLKDGKGVINRVRMSVHQAPHEARKGDQAPSVRELKDKTFYNFWGIPEGRSQDARKVVLHYGTGYLDPRQFDAVNEHLYNIRGAVAAARLH